MTENSRERLNDLVAEAEANNYVNGDGKALPYLGWYWRDVSNSAVQISWYRGKLWLNVAKKWDYPRIRITNDYDEEREEYVPGELDQMCTELADVVETVVDQGGILQKQKEQVQEILFDHAGQMPVNWYSCNYCEEERANYLGFEPNSLTEHIEAEHEDEIEFNDSGQSLLTRFEDYEIVTHHYIDVDPNSDTRGSKLECGEVDS